MAGSRRRKAAILAALQAADSMGDDSSCLGAGEDVVMRAVIAHSWDKRRGRKGRAWESPRNDKSWLFKHARASSFVESGSWRQTLRVSPELFDRIVEEARSRLAARRAKLRDPLPAELSLASSLMAAGGMPCGSVANQLGIGASPVSKSVKQASRVISEMHESHISLPRAEEEAANVMEGLRRIRGLPCCVGAADGAHIKWRACPEEQCCEHIRYKSFPSIVIFIASTAGRRIICADIGSPGALGDSAICDRSELKKAIDDGKWIGSDAPPLKIGDVEARPHLIGDCAFALGANMMKAASDSEANANPALKSWNSAASQARKPVERAFGILKNRLFALISDISFFCKECIILHSLCLESSDCGEDFFASWRGA